VFCPSGQSVAAICGQPWPACRSPLRSALLRCRPIRSLAAKKAVPKTANSELAKLPLTAPVKRSIIQDNERVSLTYLRLITCEVAEASDARRRFSWPSRAWPRFKAGDKEAFDAPRRGQIPPTACLGRSSNLGHRHRLKFLPEPGNRRRSCSACHLLGGKCGATGSRKYNT
jgi:hypothetical protein